MELFPGEVSTDVVMQRTERRRENSLGFGQLGWPCFSREGVVRVVASVRAGPLEVVGQRVGRHLPGLARDR